MLHVWPGMLVSLCFCMYSIFVVQLAVSLKRLLTRMGKQWLPAFAENVFSVQLCAM